MNIEPSSIDPYRPPLLESGEVKLAWIPKDEYISWASTLDVKEDRMTRWELIWWIVTQSPTIIKWVFRLIKIMRFFMAETEKNPYDLYSTILGAVVAVLNATIEVISTGSITWKGIAISALAAIWGYITNKGKK